MDEFSEHFKQWMDERSLSVEALAVLMNKEAGTIYQWRSRGVPKRDTVRSHVTKTMERFDAEQAKKLKNLHSITLTVDQEQFDRWNRAALRQRQIIREWAIEGLDRLARQEFQKPYVLENSDLDKVAEKDDEGGGYHTKVDRAAIQQAIEGAEVPVLVTDADGVIRAANGRFMQLCGHPPQEMVGSRLSSVLHGPTTTEAERLAARAVREAGSGVFTIHNHHADGSAYVATVHIRRAGKLLVGIASADAQGFQVPAAQAEAELARLAAAIEATAP